MPKHAQPRAVFFDLGGTLFSYREIPRLSGPIFHEAIERLGAPIERGEVGRAYAMASREAAERYVPRDYYLHRDLFLDTYRRFVDSLGASADDDFFEWLYESQREVMVSRVSLREDCVHTLQTLRGRGLSLSIVSNIDDDYLHPMVENFGLAPHMDHWSSSEEAQSCKPHPGIFELALEKSGHEAGEVVFVGDSRHADIVGARSMGMRTVLIVEPDGGAAPLDSGQAEPDRVIERLGELVGYLDSLTEG